MPKREQRGKPTWLGWVFLSVCAGALVYCVADLVLHSIWTALGFGLFAAAIAVSNAITIRKFKHIRASRQGQDICTFARSIPIRNLDTWVVRATYEEVAACMGNEKEPFPVHAADRLKEDLGIDGEDLGDVICSIARRCGRSLNDFDKDPLYAGMKTVEDLIKVMIEQPKDETAEQPVAD